MSILLQGTKLIHPIPKSVFIILVTISIVGFFAIGFDQGHIFSLIYGESSFAEQFLHELTHDMRHAAGFPCH